MTHRTNSAKTSVKQIINEPAFSAYAVRFDIDDSGNSFYDLDSFINALMFELVDFSYGGDYWRSVEPDNPTEALSEAAKAIFRISDFKQVYDLYEQGGIVDDDVIDKNLRRGELGELILFFLLKNFHDTIPLLSKIYFKDTDNQEVHGFDAVHYHEQTKTLWLGESKIYTDPKKGIKSLIDDIKSHVKSDYLNREFTLVGKKFKVVPVTTEMPEQKRNTILALLNAQASLSEKVSHINLPLLCTFPSETFSEYKEESAAFLEAYNEEMQNLKSFFEANNDHPLKGRLNIILLLMPVKSKRDIVWSLLQRLYKAQSLVT